MLSDLLAIATLVAGICAALWVGRNDCDASIRQSREWGRR